MTKESTKGWRFWLVVAGLYPMASYLQWKERRDAIKEQRRWIREWDEQQRNCEHKWIGMVDPVTLEPSTRYCQKCCKKEVCKGVLWA